MFRYPFVSLNERATCGQGRGVIHVPHMSLILKHLLLGSGQNAALLLLNKAAQNDIMGHDL